MLFSILTSCIQQESQLKQAISQSGDNHIELEKVLLHYSVNQSDSLKLKAAKFLIENMPGHYSILSDELSNYKQHLLQYDAYLKAPAHIRAMFDVYPYQASLLKLAHPHKVEDIKIIKADYLIDNIDKAFLHWEGPWGKHLTFDEFCETLLPYRVDIEPLSHWRDSLSPEFSPTIDWLSHIDEYAYSPYQACQAVNDILYKSTVYANQIFHGFRHPLISQNAKDWNCVQYVYGVQYVMRDLGVPVHIDYTPQYGVRGNRHYWNSVLHYTGHSYPFQGYNSGPERSLNPHNGTIKVFRRSYARNRRWISEIVKDEPIPPFFENPFVKDVSHEYQRTFNIHIHLTHESTEKRKFAYLCAFNNEKWVPIHFGEISENTVTFENVGTGIACIAGYWINDEIVPASYPFLITSTGKPHYLRPDKKQTQTLRLKRKYPLVNWVNRNSDKMVGAKIEASHLPSFIPSVEVSTLSENAYSNYADHFISHPYKYRYWRILIPRKTSIAELEFFSGNDTVPLKGNFFASPKEKGFEQKKAALSDRDKLTSAEIQDWVAIDLGAPASISRIHYLPLTDDNNIVPGETYELLVGDDKGFNSLGMKVAEYSYIDFDSVPVNGLYWIRNHTKGREERIFTFERNRVIFR